MRFYVLKAPELTDELKTTLKMERIPFISVSQSYDVEFDKIVEPP